MSNRFKGRLLRWNDSKAYGFIQPDQGGKDVFIHISAFSVRHRRPRAGDVVYYRLEVGKDGRTKAVDACVAGITNTRANQRQSEPASQSHSARYFGMAASVILILVGVAFFDKIELDRFIGSASLPVDSALISNRTARLQKVFDRHLNDVQVEGQGVVSKMLPDDTQGSRHQRFILRLESGQTLLIAHNIDLAPRIDSLREGETIAFFGEYQWNEQGGVIHWTHKDSENRHIAGWLLHRGRIYQ